ncbi:MAG: type I DNA topoisomerase [Deltaproteobacteria bacterium]|jgi:DNA topoisomerase-1|nr:type I DNA topoisomerase [Deltaproteobacteria bacterium]
MNLLIVESPGKIKKIRSILPNDWKVAASIGHVRDLPENDMGVFPPDFIPRYVVTDRGQKVLADLKALSDKAESVFLATDQDREGEAIAWHLADSLQIKNPKRVTYTEITESAVKKAMENPRPIDMNLVKAQEGRRVLDRLYGYHVSPALKSVSGLNLTAGRVQSPALRLVVERERAIREFVPSTHYGVELLFGEGETAWKAVWNPKNFLKEGEERMGDLALAQRVADLKEVKVASFQEGEQNVAPPPPFITSSLQQAASNALKISPKMTMSLAQSLYESGHITYMRTDCPNMADEAIKDIRDLATFKGLPIPEKPRIYKGRDSAQEAHEAIRPTKIKNEIAGENELERALYKLIWVRSVASQLMDAVYSTTKGQLVQSLDKKSVNFDAKGRKLKSPGWKALMPKDQSLGDSEKEKDPEMNNPVPRLTLGELLYPNKSELKTKKTTAPQRYTQASLIRDLEKRGIGRPSTYASILENIMTRNYIQENKKRQLQSTDTGDSLIAYLKDGFAFLEYDFTKGLEERLDDIALGKSQYLPVVSEANGILERELSAFLRKLVKGSRECPVCKGPLRHLEGKTSNGSRAYNYWKCLSPQCGYKYDDLNGEPVYDSKRKSILSAHVCQRCQSPLWHLTREESPGNPGYNFWKCSKETCTMSYTDDGGTPAYDKPMDSPDQTGEHCSKCGSLLRHLVREKSSTSSGYNYWKCSNSSCSANYDDLDGKPDPKSVRQAIQSAFTCPECNSQLRHFIRGPEGGLKPYNYWRCTLSTCRAAYEDREDSPDYDKPYVEKSDVNCPSCGSPLRHLKKESGNPQDDYNYWRCTNEKECGAVYNDLNDQPDPTTLRRSVMSGHYCPFCQSILKHHVRAEGKLGAAYNYWACANRDCGTRMDDLNGEPNLKNYSTNVLSEHLCPDCGTALRHLKKEGEGKEGYNYWKCQDLACGNFFDDLNGAPDFKSKRKSSITDHACPLCGSKLIHRTKESSPQDHGYNYWTCQNRGCKASFLDLNGTPSKDLRGSQIISTEHSCPDCGRPMRHIYKAPDETNAGYNFWGCSGFPDCKVTFNDEDGKPGTKRGGDQGELSTEHMCPECGKPLRHRVKKGEDGLGGYDFWGCSGFPDCRVALNDIDGQPDLKNYKKTVPSGFKCPKCQSDLIRRKGVSSKTGYDYDFFACSNRNCRATFEAVDDKPLERK